MVPRLLRRLTGAVAAAALAAALAATPARADDRGDAFSEQEILEAATAFFGGASRGIAAVLEKVFEDLGQPTAYIAGEEISGAFVVGLRYGKGRISMKSGERRPIFWQGPSIGFDFGGNASRTFVLVYGLAALDDVFRRFPGVEGTFYFVAGAGVNYQADGGVTLAPIRTGLGVRTGANLGYLHYAREHSWIPF